MKHDQASFDVDRFQPIRQDAGRVLPKRFRPVSFRYLFSRVGRQVEHEHCQEGDANARDDEVDRVKERLPPHRYVERNVQIRLVAARVKLHISFLNQSQVDIKGDIKREKQKKWKRQKDKKNETINQFQPYWSTYAQDEWRPHAIQILWRL